MSRNLLRPWNSDADHRLRMMAKAGWSVHMAAAQLERLPYDIETRAEVLGVKLSDRTAGNARPETGAGKAAEAVDNAIRKGDVSKLPGDVLP